MKLLRIPADKVEKGIVVFRHVLLHTSTMGFSADFIHECIGKAMILAAPFERVHGFIVTYSAWAAVVIVYLDGHREKVREHAEHQEARVLDLEPLPQDEIVQRVEA